MVAHFRTAHKGGVPDDEKTPPGRVAVFGLSAQIGQSDRGAAESASRLSEAATAMNEMNATVQEVARNAGMASSASAEAKQKAE